MNFESSPKLPLRDRLTRWAGIELARFTPASARIPLRYLRRLLGLSAMLRVIKELKRRGLDVSGLNALEVFGGTGDSHLRDYASKVASLEVWEINPACEPLLKQHFPKARIVVTDTFKEVEKVPRRFGLIVVDNPSEAWSSYCEHFELFPGIFRVAEDSAILIINVIPEIISSARHSNPDLFSDRQLERRRSFYDTDRPEEIPFEKMLEVYRRLITENGFSLEWSFLQKRRVVYYLVLCIRKVPPARAGRS